MDTIITLIESAAVIVLGVLFLKLFSNIEERTPIGTGVAIGVVFGLVGVISMMDAVQVTPGFRIDARNVVVTLSAGAGGPISAVLTATIVSVARLSFGGGGAVPGVISIWMVATGAAALWAWTRYRGKNFASWRYILSLAGVSAIVPVVAVQLTLGSDPALVMNILKYVVPVDFIATLALGWLVLGDVERRQALRGYETSQARLRTLVNNAPCVLFQLAYEPDAMPRLEYVSDGTTRIIGYEPAEILASPDLVLAMMPEEDLANLARLLEESRESGTRWAMDTRLRRKDGDRVWVSISGEPRQEQNNVVWDGTIFDVTQQKLNEQLKNEFIATVSHELRTPMTAIRGSLGLIASGAMGAISDKAASLIRIAHSNSERLVQLINDILDIERIESGRMPFDSQPTPLRPLVEYAVEASANYRPESRVSVDVVDHAEGIRVDVDPARFDQVMTNLLSNAVKFSPPGGQVTVEISRCGPYARISVKDHGPGIPLDFQRRIFGKFEQADLSDSRAKGGTGLGLSIAKSIVERLSGRISFETRLKHGTTFHVDLPEQREDAYQRNDQFASAVSASGGKSDSVEVVSSVLDDEKPVRKAS